MTLETTIERDEEELEIVVEFSVTPACRGRRDSLMGKRNAGPPLEPDSPADLEIESVTHHSQEFELTTGERERIEERCWDLNTDREDRYSED